MSLQTDLIERIKLLSEDQQLVVKSLVDELMRARQHSPGGEPTPWYGSLEHLGVHLTEEDIAEARREMWGNFPREVGP